MPHNLPLIEELWSGTLPHADSAHLQDSLALVNDGPTTQALCASRPALGASPFQGVSQEIRILSRTSVYAFIMSTTFDQSAPTRGASRVPRLDAFPSLLSAGSLGPMLDVIAAPHNVPLGVGALGGGGAGSVHVARPSKVTVTPERSR